MKMRKSLCRAMRQCMEFQRYWQTKPLWTLTRGSAELCSNRLGSSGNTIWHGIFTLVHLRDNIHRQLTVAGNFESKEAITLNTLSTDDALSADVASYDYHLVHRPAEGHTNTDAISRLALGSPDNE